MTKAVWTSGAPQVKGMTADAFGVQVQPRRSVVNPGSVSVVQYRDQVIDRSIGALVENNAAATMFDLASANFVSLTPAVCGAVDAQGVPAWVGNGVCVLEATHKRGAAWGRRNVEFPCTRAGGQTFDTIRFNQSADPTSLRHHVITSLYAAISGKSPSADTCDLFSSANYGVTKSATLNPNMIFDSSKFSFLTFSNGGANSAYFIGPRHALYANHTAGNYGTVTVRRKDGSFQTVNRLAQYAIPRTDFAMGIFDADVIGIDYAKLMPSSFVQKANSPTWDLTGNVPTFLNFPVLMLHYNPGQASSTPYPISTTHSRHLRVGQLLRNQQVRDLQNWPNWVYVPGTSDIAESVGWNSDIREPEASKWSSLAYGGDSSSPVFMWVNGEPVLLSCFYGATSGPFFPTMQPYINTIMNQLATQAGISSPNYSANWADLSMFPSYP